ncbi:MAG TPA: protein kinase, partial [Candidatus Acidoferrum sp.]|nr:protein kinase [Candidatus Acidoferrum sp.]
MEPDPLSALNAKPPPQQTLSYDQKAITDAPPSLTWGLARGGTVHRYIILDRVGVGGMGVVYGAYDPSLDRRVALKFLAPDGADPDGVHEKRLLREAQAMARLSHPNVAVVYEVGVFEGRVYLAMEYVDGVDLRAWLAEKPKSFTQILGVFRAA